MVTHWVISRVKHWKKSLWPASRHADYATSGNGKNTKRSVMLGTTQVAVTPDQSGGALVLTASDHNEAKAVNAARTLSNTLVNALSTSNNLQYYGDVTKLEKQRGAMQAQ